MDNNRISLQIVGADIDGEDVRFDDFINQLNAVKRAVTETDRVVSDGQSVYFRVVDLKHSSPALVTLEAVAIEGRIDNSAAVISTFFSAVSEIQRENRTPHGFDYQAMQAFKELAVYRGGSTITRTVISRSGDTQPLSASLPQTVDKILGPDIYEMGSVTGKLDHINVHMENVCTIYPTIRAPKLKCVFPSELRRKIISAVDQYVTVYGQLKYKAHHPHPYEMEIEDIEVNLPEEAIPSLFSLRGAARGAIGNKSSEEFVRGVRDDWG